MEIDINKYLTEEDIKDIVADEVRGSVRQHSQQLAVVLNCDPELTWYKKFWENQ